MKNTLIGILLIVSVGSLTFGFIQKGKADNVLATCLEFEKLAQEHELQAREFQKMAELAQNEVEVQRTICEEQLKALRK
jgi:hypothetical protein